MNVLVMLEESPDHSPVLAHVNSRHVATGHVPFGVTNEG